MEKEITNEGFAYKCKKYSTRLECKTCDGFGRNSNDEVDTSLCYEPNIPKKIDYSTKK